jgi:hypothetical protein
VHLLKSSQYQVKLYLFAVQVHIALFFLGSGRHIEVRELI